MGHSTGYKTEKHLGLQSAALMVRMKVVLMVGCLVHHLVSSMAAHWELQKAVQMAHRWVMRMALMLAVLKVDEMGQQWVDQMVDSKDFWRVDKWAPQKVMTAQWLVVRKVAPREHSMGMTVHRLAEKTGHYLTLS